MLEDTLSNLHIHHKDSYLYTIKSVWNNRHPYEKMYWSEKLLLVSLIFTKLLMPSFRVRHYTEKKESYFWALDLYHFCIPLLFFIILINHRDNSIIIMILVTYLLVDLFISILSSLLLSDIFVKKLSIRKQFISLACNLWEMIFWFALLYQHYNALAYLSQPEQPVHALWAIYYTLATLTTVWYGDIGAINTNGMIISTIQMLYGLIFMGIVLSAYFSKVNLRAE